MILSINQIALAILLLGSTPTAQSSGDSKDETIEAAVGWSEWCPSGSVTLNLRTGWYELAPPPARPACLPATNAQIVRAALPPIQLDEINRAVAVTRVDGLIEPACLAGNPPPDLVSNAAGPFTLELRSRGKEYRASNELRCWTAAATKLQRLLEQTFVPPRRRR